MSQHDEHYKSGILASLFSVITTLLISGYIARCAEAQIVTPPVINNSFGGISIDTDGVVHYREVDAKVLEQARAKVKQGQHAKDEKLIYISLPKIFEEARELIAAKKTLPEELRFLGGMTSLRYVFVYPEEHDLIIAGPAEPWDTSNPLEPFGKITGRPVMQLEDLVVAMRTVRELGRRGGTFGCSIDPSADSLQKAGEVMKQYARASRAERMKAMGDALGPQKVTVFGTADNTRLAFTCIAADYRLKRIALGMDSPVAGVGSAMDNTRAAANRVWFEVMYEPLLVSKDGNAFEVRGQRLQLKAGAQSFEPRGATEKVLSFAKAFTQKVPQLCATVPLFADLQNLADASLLASLIRADGLDQRVGWDTGWLLDPAAFPVTVVPVSRSAETLVCYTSGSICAGGVGFTMAPVVGRDNRQEDAKGDLASAKLLVKRAKAESGKSAVLKGS